MAPGQRFKPDVATGQIPPFDGPHAKWLGSTAALRSRISPISTVEVVAHLQHRTEPGVDHADPLAGETRALRTSR